MPIPTLEFITGSAGTGKTTLLRKRIADAREAEKRSYGTLSATTGIAAINLSGNTGDAVTTVNSQLKYYDTASLQDSYASRKLHNMLKEVSRKGMNLVIDEVSMMDKVQLDLIHDALVEVNEVAEVFNRGGLGLVVSGDFCQLPPVKAEFAFNAKCWPKFKITKLDKIWRQDNLQYIEALNAARRGDGETCSEILCSLPEVMLRPTIDSHFDGTTIVPINRLVDSMNKIRLDELIEEGKTIFEFKSFRWGKQLAEWKQIPETITVTKDAYVMILANDSPKFSYANGSCGWVTDADIDAQAVYVELRENENEVKVRRVTRCYYQKETPEGMEIPEFDRKKEWKEKNKEYTGKMADVMYRTYLLELKLWMRNKNGLMCPYFDFEEGKWVVGEISYTPIRLAYASTVHKCVSIESTVKTSRGIVKAGEVEIGDGIFDGDEYVTVKDKAFGTEPCVVIKTEMGFETTVGYEHPILTYGDGFVLAKDIGIGRWVKVALDYQNKSQQLISRTGYDKTISVELTKLVYPVVDFTTSSGRFMCDGIVTHNSQGLTLDCVQIDYSHAFFGEPSMSYVALSRCRTPRGLTIVGSRGLIASRTNISSEILGWI